MSDGPAIHRPTGEPSGNPYWDAWLRATGGGRNYEYIIWNGEQWRAFRRERGYPPERPTTDAIRAEFGAWLEARYPADGIASRAVKECATQ